MAGIEQQARSQWSNVFAARDEMVVVIE